MYKIDSESTEGEKEDERGEVMGRKGLTGKPNRARSFTERRGSMNGYKRVNGG